MPHSHHSHSGQFCRHAKDQLEDIVKEAIQQGFETYALTEHAPRYRLGDLYPEEADLTVNDLQHGFDNFLETASRLKAKYEDQIELLVGMETDCIRIEDLQRTGDLRRKRKEIDFIVGSIHHVSGIPIDFDRKTWLRAVHAAQDTARGSTIQVEWDGRGLSTNISSENSPQLRDDYQPTMPELKQFILKYLDEQHQMLDTLRPEVVGHFDLCRLWTPDLELSSDQLDDTGAIKDAVKRNIGVVISYGGLFEVNTAAYRKGWNAPYPSASITAGIRKLGGRFCLSDDAHSIAQVGLNYHKLPGDLALLGIDTVYHLTRLSGGSDELQAVPVQLPSTMEDVRQHQFWSKQSDRA